MPDAPEDPIRDFMKELDDNGELDVEHMEDAVVWLHGTLRQHGVNPEDPNAYRALVFFAIMIRAYTPLAWAAVTNEVVRISLRALRDLDRRGGGS